MSHLFDIRGKVALVTGGSSGIGKMIAAGFAEAGAKVYVSSRKASSCESVAEELSHLGECVPLPGDVSTEHGCRTLASDLSAAEHSLSILVNNAGTSWGAPLEDLDDTGWDKVLSVNLKGSFHLTKFLLPLLRGASTPDDPARVINIGSIDGMRVPPLWLWENYSYSASKAAVHHLTRHLALKLAPDVLVNAIAPGAFESKMMSPSLPDIGDRLVANTPLRRIGRGDDMAGAAIFLASRASAFMTGVVMPVDGGIATVG